MNSTLSYKDNKTLKSSNKITGELVNLENESFYKISNSHTMRPFFMTIVSDSNHWMFISSNGGLTAGRKNAEYALFPYYTDDKITALAESTGCKSIFRITKEGKEFLWEPFSERQAGIYKITRNVYKNVYGNKVVFEEINEDLNVTFKYQWNSSDEFGFVRKATFVNNSNEDLEISLLDGFQDILPYGVGSDIQGIRSNLVDAYKKCELEADAGLGIYALSAIIVDKAEPSEALKANVVWSLGINNPKYLLSSLQLKAFRKGQTVTQETDIKAEKGAYFVNADINYSPTFGNYKPTANLVFSYFSDRIDAIGSGQLGNVIEKGVPTLDFILRNKINKNLEVNFSLKNLLNPTVTYFRETSLGDITVNSANGKGVSDYKRGMDLGLQLKYKF